MNLPELFPDVWFAVYGWSDGSEVHAWIMCEIDMTDARSPVAVLLTPGAQ